MIYLLVPLGLLWLAGVGVEAAYLMWQVWQ